MSCIFHRILPYHLLFIHQACHLLNVLSKELLGDFEPCAELFIPVYTNKFSFLPYIVSIKLTYLWIFQMLFKLVVITVLVIAESADTCIKTVSYFLIYILLLSFSLLLLTWGILQILRNCKISRILPRIADTAKNDRSAVLRARYMFVCGYLPASMYIMCWSLEAYDLPY